MAEDCYTRHKVRQYPDKAGKIADATLPELRRPSEPTSASKSKNAVNSNHSRQHPGVGGKR